MTKESVKKSFQELLKNGQALYDKSDFKGAIKLYKTALVMSKDVDSTLLSSVYVKLANAYYKIEDRDKSTYYYEQYLKEYPTGQTSVFSRLAHAYYYIDSDITIN